MEIENYVNELVTSVVEASNDENLAASIEMNDKSTNQVEENNYQNDMDEEDDELHLEHNNTLTIENLTSELEQFECTELNIDTENEISQEVIKRKNEEKRKEKEDEENKEETKIINNYADSKSMQKRIKINESDNANEDVDANNDNDSNACNSFCGNGDNEDTSRMNGIGAPKMYSLAGDGSSICLPLSRDDDNDNDNDNDAFAEATESEFQIQSSSPPSSQRSLSLSSRSHVGRRPKQGQPCTMKTLIDDRLIRPGAGQLVYDQFEQYGVTFVGDLLPDGTIGWSGTKYQGLTTWAASCRGTIPQVVERACTEQDDKLRLNAWAIVKYVDGKKLRRLDAYKLRWYRRQKKIYGELNGDGDQPMSVKTRIRRRSSLSGNMQTLSQSFKFNTNRFKHQLPKLAKRNGAVQEALNTFPFLQSYLQQNHLNAKLYDREPLYNMILILCDRFREDQKLQTLRDMLDVNGIGKGSFSDHRALQFAYRCIQDNLLEIDELSKGDETIQKMAPIFAENDKVLQYSSLIAMETTKDCTTKNTNNNNNNNNNEDDDNDEKQKDEQSKEEKADISKRLLCSLSRGTMIETMPFNQIGCMQPFKISVSSHVLLLVDFHMHLVCEEVSGYLGGRWDANTKTLVVMQAFPLYDHNRDDYGDDNSDRNRDADPNNFRSLSSNDLNGRSKQRDAIKAKLLADEMILVGWYHSHVDRAPHPSIADIRRQMHYQRSTISAITSSKQSKMSSSSSSSSSSSMPKFTSFQPLVGLIGSPYYRPRVDGDVRSLFQFFWVMPQFATTFPFDKAQTKETHLAHNFATNSATIGRPMQLSYMSYREKCLTPDLLVLMKEIAARNARNPNFVKLNEVFITSDDRAKSKQSLASQPLDNNHETILANLNHTHTKSIIKDEEDNDDDDKQTLSTSSASSSRSNRTVTKIWEKIRVSLRHNFPLDLIESCDSAKQTIAVQHFWNFIQSRFIDPLDCERNHNDNDNDHGEQQSMADAAEIRTKTTTKNEK